MDMQRYKKIFHGILTAANVTKIACIAGFCLMAVLAIVMPFLPENIMNTSLSLYVGSNSLRLNPAIVQNVGIMKNYLYITISTIMVVLAVAFGILRYFIKLMRNAADGKPFDPQNSLFLRKMGMRFIIGGIVINVISDVHVKYVEKTYAGLFSEVVYTFDFSWVIVGLLIICLAFIFQYGAFLQKEYDETL